MCLEGVRGVGGRVRVYVGVGVGVGGREGAVGGVDESDGVVPVRQRTLHPHLEWFGWWR